MTPADEKKDRNGVKGMERDGKCWSNLKIRLGRRAGDTTQSPLHAEIVESLRGGARLVCPASIVTIWRKEWASASASSGLRLLISGSPRPEPC